jgi:predicted site-specific integrase-resolvase
MTIESLRAWATRNGVSPHNARRWAALGVIPTIKLGNRRMVIREVSQ